MESNSLKIKLLATALLGMVPIFPGYSLHAFGDVVQAGLVLVSREPRAPPHPSACARGDDGARAGGKTDMFAGPTLEKRTPLSVASPSHGGSWKLLCPIMVA